MWGSDHLAHPVAPGPTQEYPMHACVFTFRQVRPFFYVHHPFVCPDIANQ